MTPEICFCSRKPCGVTLLRSLLQLSRTFPKLFSVVLISAFCSPPNVLITLRRAFQLCMPGFLGFLLFLRGFKRPWWATLGHSWGCLAVLFRDSPESLRSSSPPPSSICPHMYSEFIIRNACLRSVAPQVTYFLFLPLPTSQKTVFCGQHFPASCRFSLTPCNLTWLHSTTTDKNLSPKSPNERISRSAALSQQVQSCLFVCLSAFPIVIS